MNPPLEVRAGRIRFVPGRKTGDEVLRVFAGPHEFSAIEEALAPDQLLRETSAPADTLLVFLLPVGDGLVHEWEGRIRGWLNAGGGPESLPLLETTIQSDRLLWRAGKAAVIGAPQRWQENLLGLLELAHYEGQLRALESELAADWLTAEQDIPLTHSVSDPQLDRRAHVDEMTRRVTGRRLRFAWLEPRLEKPSPNLPGPARRAFAEFALQAELLDRSRAVDDRLEAMEDLYELANDRLSEFQYFRREFRLEVWIIVLLVLEVIIMAGELLMLYWEYIYHLHSGE